MPAGSIHTVNLTELELKAEGAGLNLADGHARQDLSPTQQVIIERLPQLFAEAGRRSVPDLDRQLHSGFLGALGQQDALHVGQVLSCYSSSVATEIVGRALHRAGRRIVGVQHPTFDNIPDVLAGVGLELRAVDEMALQDPALLPLGLDALFVTTPNNPTGTVLEAESLAVLAGHCAERGMVLVLDSCFRGFDARTWYDHYQVLDVSGVEWVVIEDTGKVFPSLDLKVGLLAVSRSSTLPVRRIYTDLLLGVSPLITLVLTEFSRDGANGGFVRLHEFIAANRATLREAVEGLDYDAWCDDSRISVQRIRLPDGIHADEASALLRRDGLHVLPCTQFHWSRPGEGQQHLRVALSRRPESLQRGTDLLQRRLQEWTRGRSVLGATG